VIEISDRCVLLNETEFAALIMPVKKVYEELERLKIETSFLQLLYQDPMFYEIFGALEAFKMTDQLATYTLYLYTRFRLIPILRTFSPEDFVGKLNPVPVMFVSEDEDMNEDLLGYRRKEDLEEKLSGASNEVVETVNRLKDQEEGYIHAVVCDGIISRTQRETYVEVFRLLSRYRPMTKAAANYIRFKVSREDWPEGRTSRWAHLYSPVEGHASYFALTNLFGIVPTTDFRICPSRVLRRTVTLSNKKFKLDIKSIGFSKPRRV
jgi:hypothetical protein